MSYPKLGSLSSLQRYSLGVHVGLRSQGRQLSHNCELVRGALNPSPTLHACTVSVGRPRCAPRVLIHFHRQCLGAHVAGHSLICLISELAGEEIRSRSPGSAAIHYRQPAHRVDRESLPIHRPERTKLPHYLSRYMPGMYYTLLRDCTKYVST